LNYAFDFFGYRNAIWNFNGETAEHLDA
jgi:hypothetical protein